MNSNELNTTDNGTKPSEAGLDLQPTGVPRPQPPEPEPIEQQAEEEANQTAASEATEEKPGLDRKKLILLGGGLLAAVLFFGLTAIIGRSPNKKTGSGEPPSQISQPQGSNKPQGSVTPLMDTVRKPDQNNADGQLGPNDIKRMRSGDKQSSTSDSGGPQKPPASNQRANSSLAGVPSFADTQQKWEEPRPYGGASGTNNAQGQQQQNALKETSLVFVRTQTQLSGTSKESTVDNNEPVLEMAPGSRFLAKLQMEASTAVADQVVAEVEYTYAIGEQIIIPAGARVFGHLRAATQSGLVDIQFDEIDLLGGGKEKIDAVGVNLNMGPIKGIVTGKNTGKNLLVKSVSGIGSTIAMVAGTNTGSAYSEDDMIRQRLAENIGSAGDSAVMNMALNSRIVVSVPAETRIYVVFTKHEQTPSTLHRIDSNNP